MKFLTKFYKSKRFEDVEGFNFGVELFGPPVMTAWCYIADGIMIDTGISKLRKVALGIANEKKPKRIILSHHHEDHSGNAGAISKLLNINVYGHPYTIKKLSNPYPIRMYQHVFWGKTDPVKVKPIEPVFYSKKLKFRSIHTPGHSKDHTVYLEENNGWLFSGDLYLGDKIKFFRSDECFEDQMHSLKTVLKLDFQSLFCGHRPIMKGGKDAIKRKLDFFENFSGTIRTFYDKGYNKDEIVKMIDTKEDSFVKLATFKNACFANMADSAFEYVTSTKDRL